MNIYLVGGAVRDELLGLPVAERDWVVVGATHDEMLGAGFNPVPGDAPVFWHPESGEEYALARTETKTGPGYRGFRFDAGPDVTLEADLARRDLTINAIARSADGDIVDPFDGRGDLEKGLLQHVTPAFAEDPVRVLRIARFAARFGALGFRVAHGTHAVLRAMVASGELAHLVPERVWAETAKALGYEQPWRFFEVLAACGALAVVCPTLAAGHAAPEPHDGGEPAAVRALKRAARASDDGRVRLAVYAAAAGVNADSLPTLWRELPAPAAWRETVADLVLHQAALGGFGALDAPARLDLIERLRLERDPGRLERLRAGLRALTPNAPFAALDAALGALTAVDAAAIARAAGPNAANAVRGARVAALNALDAGTTE
ncbi:MAG: multifunctional CCA tRNA nucleotidyl transferase/2'3'-cyclic phosphodiesterase/2'nucleotidase/phosphatase [Chromatiales bacterium]|nr:multifunctional CCA tRNA nucleotidyl transferase/2'3'-cyclic phosphodiesterase/2'nucleotidase/phosphatase [Chromatiales bacterium]